MCSFPECMSNDKLSFPLTCGGYEVYRNVKILCHQKREKATLHKVVVNFWKMGGQLHLQLYPNFLEQSRTKKCKSYEMLCMLSGHDCSYQAGPRLAKVRP